MIILVSGATSTLNLLGHPRIGNLIVPGARNHPDQLELRPGAWAMDNGAFKAFDPVRFLWMLDRYRSYPGCLFVVAPDRVGDPTTTTRLFWQWTPIIRSYGFPVAYVLQDGVVFDQIPYEACDALFVGGTDKARFKYSSTVRTAIAYARALGLWTHMGRVNTKERLLHAVEIGCLSCDGTGFSKWALVNLPLALRWLGDDICTSSLEVELRLPPPLLAVLRSRALRGRVDARAGRRTVGALPCGGLPDGDA